MISAIRTLVSSTLIITATVLLAAELLPERADALPSFGRQTGTPCGSCHTDYPQLTPFGRRFKLGGYTMGGGENTEAYKRTFAGSSWFPPLSVFGTVTRTHTQGDQQNLVDDMGFKANNNVTGEVGVAYAGAITSNIGAFVEGKLDGVERKFGWEMADIRYANTGNLFSTNAIFGITAHNNPTLQDAWNSTPAFGYPFNMSDLAPTPDGAVMLDGQFSFKVLGVGAYTYINDFFYLEVSGYRSLSRDTLTRLGVSADAIQNAGAIDNVAPYWRLAVEPHWGNNSLMLGTFGMVANIIPQRMEGFGTDRKVDIGFDAQYQYIIDAYSFTARARFITEKQDLTASQALGFAMNGSNTLNSFKLSGTFVYGQNERVAITGSYFNTYGSADALLYPNAIGSNGSPNTSGWIAEVAYMPFGMNSPTIWPWFNVKIGAQYTWYEKFNGASTNVDGNGRNAKDNNTFLLYASFAL